MTFPKTLGACADRLYRLREQRLAQQRKVDDLRQQETALKEHVIRALGDADARAVVGTVARAGLGTEDVGRVEDWDALRDHVLATGDLTVFQRRLNDGYLRERWEAGDVVPGVGKFTVVKISLTKVR